MESQLQAESSPQVFVEHISEAFGKHKVLDDVHFELPAGSIAGLIGPSGGGKSVLMKIMAQVYEPDSGEVRHGLADQSQVSLMFQEGALFDSLSVFDNVAFPMVRGKVPCANLPGEVKESVRQSVQAILARVGLSSAAFKMPGQLSGGMRRRVSLARAVVAKPKLLLLDDPTSGLDPVASSVIMELIGELHAEYRPTLLIVSHDLRRLLPVVEQIYALFGGKIVFQGSVPQLASKAEQEVRKFVSCRFDLE